MTSILAKETLSNKEVIEYLNKRSSEEDNFLKLIVLSSQENLDPSTDSLHTEAVASHKKFIDTLKNLSYKIQNQIVLSSDEKNELKDILMHEKNEIDRNKLQGTSSGIVKYLSQIED